MIPERTRKSIERYVLGGVPTGGFLQAVLENKLSEATSRADGENLAALYEIVKLIWNDIPEDCWGSPRKVKKWIGHKGNIWEIK